MSLELLKSKCKECGLTESDAMKLHNNGIGPDLIEKTRTVGIGLSGILALVTEYGPIAAEIARKILDMISSVPAPVMSEKKTDKKA